MLDLSHEKEEKREERKWRKIVVKTIHSFVRAASKLKADSVLYKKKGSQKR